MVNFDTSREVIKTATSVNKQNRSVSHIANLLASILLYYPEIATINLDPRSQVVKFTFYVQGLISGEDQESLQHHIMQCLDAYHFLEKKETAIIAISYQPMDSFTIIELQRDIQSLSQKEISLLVSILDDRFGDNLVSEDDEELLVDDLAMHEELIGDMLENAKKARSNIKLVALRDEGKVLVFNK
jgi:hypothetical protein